MVLGTALIQAPAVPENKTPFLEAVVNYVAVLIDILAPPQNDPRQRWRVFLVAQKREPLAPGLGPVLCGGVFPAPQVLTRPVQDGLDEDALQPHIFLHALDQLLVVGGL